MIPLAFFLLVNAMISAASYEIERTRSSRRTLPTKEEMFSRAGLFTAQFLATLIVIQSKSDMLLGAIVTFLGQLLGAEIWVRFRKSS